MLRPGPKPVDVDALKRHAGLFTRLFLHLRDGRAGEILRTDRVAKTRLPEGRVISLKHYRESGGLGDGEIVDTGGEVVAKIIAAKGPQGHSRAEQSRFEAKTRKLLSQIVADPHFEAKRIWIDDPIFPRSDLWERLKDASSTEEMKRATAAIAHWMRSYAHPRWRRELQKYSADLFHAKGLWNYPRSNRPSSDNRRAEFFGKALSGLILGISPATATRRLMRWSPLKPAPPAAPPLRARGPNCPHCGVAEVQGYPPGTVVRCPQCGERYYIARKPKMGKKKSCN